MKWNAIGDYCDIQWPHYSCGWGTFYVPITPTFTISTFAHACTPTLANPAPTQALCPPVHPSVHLHTPLCTIYPGFSYTHFTFCALAHLLHCPMACGQGNSFFWAIFQLVIPRGLQGLGPKGGDRGTPTYIQHTPHLSSDCMTRSSLQCYPITGGHHHFQSVSAQEHPPTH